MIYCRSVARRFLLASALLAGGASLLAESKPDLVAPKLREQVVADAVRVAEARNSEAKLPTPLPNPFVPRERVGEAVAPAAAPEAPPVPSVDGADLLARLAARIPATGTVMLGGESILLLGQKRLKVGELFTISFEGRNHELQLAAVTSTTFTVRRGENVHTRPVHLSATSTTTPTRP